MVQSPSWEANSYLLTYLLTYLLHGAESFFRSYWSAASQEIPRISWNPNVLYRTYKRPPPISILGQPNPVHIPTSHLLEIHPNIIHPSMPRSPQWSHAAVHNLKDHVTLRFSKVFIYSPTDEVVICLKNNIKIYIKTAPTYFSVTVEPKFVGAVLM